MSLTLMYIIYKTNRLLEKMVIFRIDMHVRNYCSILRKQGGRGLWESPGGGESAGFSDEQRKRPLKT